MKQPVLTDQHSNCTTTNNPTHVLEVLLWTCLEVLHSYVTGLKWSKHKPNELPCMFEKSSELFTKSPFCTLVLVQPNSIMNQQYRGRPTVPLNANNNKNQSKSWAWKADTNSVMPNTFAKIRTQTPTELVCVLGTSKIEIVWHQCSYEMTRQILPYLWLPRYVRRQAISEPVVHWSWQYQTMFWKKWN